MAKKTRVLILGGGISGLSAAYELSKYPEFEITLIEKKDRLGGWLETDQSESFLFEKGPRTFKTSRNAPLLTLIKELGLQEKLIPSSKSASMRYLYTAGDLKRFPSDPISFLFSSLTRKMIPGFLKEWRIPSNVSQEESIWEFASRRFGKDVAELIFDPITLGIYAGDIRKLSLQSCFPAFRRWEEEYGSVVKGAIKSCLKKKKSLFPSALFSFQEGIETLITALGENIRGRVALNQEVKSLNFFNDEMEVVCSERSYHADHIFCALPPKPLARIFQPLDEEIASIFSATKMLSLTVVNLGFDKNTLPIHGFGYLVPSKEKEEILGVVFDSAIFPSQNRSIDETRLTVMIRGIIEEADAKKIALKAIQKHLGISISPKVIRVCSAEDAIPQYEIGHRNKIDALKSRMGSLYPKMTLLGSYLGSASVSDCVAKAREEVTSWVDK